LDFETVHLPKRYEVAPDGSKIRPLVAMQGGGMAHCTLQPNVTSHAVKHRTVEEIWYFMQGRGEIWRKQGDREDIVEVGPSVCITIPTGTDFQFRCTGNEPLRFVIATMPPWPGEGEAVIVEGRWRANI